MKAKFFSLTISELFLRGSKFLFFLVLTNFYGQSVVYEYGYFTALFSIVFVFSDLGYQTYLTKEFTSKVSLSKTIENINLSIFRILFFIIVSLSILIYYFFTQKEFYFYIFMLFIVDAILAMSFSFYRARDYINKEILLKFQIGSVFILISILGLFHLDIHFLFLLLAIVLIVTSSVNSLIIKWSYLQLFIKRFSFTHIFDSLKNSAYIFLASLATIVYLRIDILMLEWFGLVDGVVYYTIASRVLELTLIVPSMIAALLLPKLTQQTATNIKKDLLNQFAIGVGVMILFLLISHIIITLLFPKYLQTITILNILLLSIPFMLINNYGFTYFVAKDISKKYFIITLLMCISNIVLNLIFIPLYGYEAAAYTTLFTEALGAMIVLYILKSNLI